MSKSSLTFLLTRANQRLNYSSLAAPLPSSKRHSYPCFTPRSIASQIDKSIILSRSVYDTRNAIPIAVTRSFNTGFARHMCKKNSMSSIQMNFLVLIEVLILNGITDRNQTILIGKYYKSAIRWNTDLLNTESMLELLLDHQTEQ